MKKKFVGILLPFLFFGCNDNLKKGYSEEKDKNMVYEILENLDDHTLDIDKKMSVYSEDVIHMGQGNRAITNLEDLRALFIEELRWGYSEMKHEAFEIHSFEDHVIVRGGVKGNWHSKDGNSIIPFETNNLITFRRTNKGELKIWHVIFNRIED